MPVCVLEHPMDDTKGSRLQEASVPHVLTAEAAKGQPTSQCLLLYFVESPYCSQHSSWEDAWNAHNPCGGACTCSPASAPGPTSSLMPTPAGNRWVPAPWGQEAHTELLAPGFTPAQSWLLHAFEA